MILTRYLCFYLSMTYGYFAQHWLRKHWLVTATSVHDPNPPSQIKLFEPTCRTLWALPTDGMSSAISSRESLRTSPSLCLQPAACCPVTGPSRAAVVKGCGAQRTGSRRLPAHQSVQDHVTPTGVLSLTKVSAAFFFFAFILPTLWVSSTDVGVRTFESLNTDYFCKMMPSTDFTNLTAAVLSGVQCNETFCGYQVGRVTGCDAVCAQARPNNTVWLMFASDLLWTAPFSAAR